jgi:ferredoxin-NADP reductase
MPVTQKLACTVEQITAHGDRVYTVALRPERQVPRFRAGQFLHLALDGYDPSGFWPESRVFSIASASTERESLRITYAVHGRYTARMERDLIEGRSVWIKMPYGDFVIDGSCDVVLFAGGTGITGFTAFLESLTPDDRQSVVLAYGARTEPLLIYRELIERCRRRAPKLNATYFVEAGGDDGAPARMARGRVSVGAVWQQLDHPYDMAYYISGPPPMLSAIRQELVTRGIDAEAIHIDAWE